MQTFENPIKINFSNRPTATTIAGIVHGNTLSRNKMETNRPQPKNPLHGVTLERMLTELVDHFGWRSLGQRIRIRCFTSDPSIASSLKFLRKTPWARQEVESLYLFLLRERVRLNRRANETSQPADSNTD
jgi:uncharacterized protein (DUF2132 family)